MAQSYVVMQLPNETSSKYTSTMELQANWLNFIHRAECWGKRETIIFKIIPICNLLRFIADQVSNNSETTDQLPNAIIPR